MIHSVLVTLCSKELLNIEILELKDWDTDVNWASVAKVASKLELNDSKLVTLVEKDPDQIDEDWTVVVTSVPFNVRDPVMFALTIFI